MTTTVDIASSPAYPEFRNWYAATINSAPGAFEIFVYHMQCQFGGLDLAGKRILEVGCGRGAVSLYLALFSGAAHVLATDANVGNGAEVGVMAPLEDGCRRTSARNLSMREVDISKNDFAAGTFDVVIANYCLHHVTPDGARVREPAIRQPYEAMFRELRRILVPGGLLSLREVPGNSLWRYSPVRLRQRQIDWSLHPTRGEWRSIARASGFAIAGDTFLRPYSLRTCGALLDNAPAAFVLGLDVLLTLKSAA